MPYRIHDVHRKLCVGTGNAHRDKVGRTEISDLQNLRTWFPNNDMVQGFRGFEVSIFNFSGYVVATLPEQRTSCGAPSPH